MCVGEDVCEGLLSMCVGEDEPWRMCVKVY
jgi:hypothetical protein